MISIPGEAYSLIKLHDKSDDSVSMVMLNTNLIDFEYKQYFDWECVVWITYDEDEATGLPTKEGYEPLNELFSQVDDMLKAPMEHPNALFFVRIVGGGVAECVWMVNNPDIAEEKLNELIDSGNHALEFEYRIDKDHGWKNYNYFLDAKYKPSAKGAKDE